MLTNLVVIILQYIFQIITLYTLHLHSVIYQLYIDNVICQVYLNKAGKNKKLKTAVMIPCSGPVLCGIKVSRCAQGLVSLMIRDDVGSPYPRYLVIIHDSVQRLDPHWIYVAIQ